MKLSDFNYDLPKELIAQEGLAEREEANLLVLRHNSGLEHRQIKNLPEYFQEGDLLILNNTKVAKAKLLGAKSTGGKVDCLLLPQHNGNSSLNDGAVRNALIRGSKIRPGTKLQFPVPGKQTPLRANVLENVKGAQYKIEFENPEQIENASELPLPPYIKKKLDDPGRYQTVYSEKWGSLAAPTAGLHFTPALLQALQSKGVDFAFLTLHVGIGTFAPIRVENVEDWKMHPEYYEVGEEAAEKINSAVQAGRRCFAVGTTSARTLESVTRESQVKPGSGWTDIFIYPGYSFTFPYAGLLTNFHLPQSTLLLLTSAFAGKERLFKAYAEAIARQYRFFSLGDAMLIFK